MVCHPQTPVCHVSSLSSFILLPHNIHPQLLAHFSYLLKLYLYSLIIHEAVLVDLHYLL